MRKILIIQTAFIGDAILMTAILEKWHKFFPNDKLDILIRKGNEGIFTNHLFLNNIFIWDKKTQKYRNLFRLISKIRSENYNFVINLQRFLSTGLLTSFSKSKISVGFDKNPLSFLFTEKVSHQIQKNIHEVERNLKLIEKFTDASFQMPQIYPSESDFEKVKNFKNSIYICIAPTSVWFTKQFPAKKWVEFINILDKNITIYLLGAKNDFDFCEMIRFTSKNIENLAGKLSLLESAALMKDAKMNFVNDSAPLHLASAVNAPTTAIFCSTIIDFGFFPLSKNAKIIEIRENLECRPCGLHGLKSCPQKHFFCAEKINVQELLNAVK